MREVDVKFCWIPDNWLPDAEEGYAIKDDTKKVSIFVPGDETAVSLKELRPTEDVVKAVCSK